MEEAYKDCASFYCEDPTKGPSDEIGKKIFKCILFVFNTEKMFFELETKRKKEEARKAPKNQLRFTDQPKIQKTEDNIAGRVTVFNKPNKPDNNNSKDLPVIQEQGTKPPKPSESMVKIPLPGLMPTLKTGIQEMSTEDRLKEL